MQQNIIERTVYTRQILHILDRGMIVALSGQRRVGKSCVMRGILNIMSQNYANSIIYIDKENVRYDAIRTYTELYAYVKENIVPEKENYLFIDEVQEIKEFEKAVLSLHNEGVCRIIVTGSNAKMLSGELSTRLRGRYMEVRIRGLSYMEFLKFHDLADDDNSLRLFLQYGGLPQLRLLGLENQDIVTDYLGNIYDTIVLRDVIERESVRNIPLLRALLKFLSDNIGKQFSARSIVKFLKSQSVDTSANIILNYLSYLSNAYIIDRVERYNIHGKRILELGEKYYFEDLGIRNRIIGGNREFDIEKVMENAVYRHLRQLGFTVFVGQLRKVEIDFVAEKADRTVYIQVTYLLANQETVDREFGNLSAITDSHPKYVVSMDRMSGFANVDGIRHLHLRSFLMLTDL